MIKGVRGAQEHLERLKRMRSQRTAEEITRILYAGGQMIELDAEQSITSGSVSGKNHVPSLPGQPPNADTRHLDTNIETEIKTGSRNPTVHVESKAAYSAFLEFGTSKMAERPFMRPALAKNREKIQRLVRDKISQIVRGSR